MKGYSSLVRFKFRAGIMLGLLAALVILVTDVSSATLQKLEVAQVQADQDSPDSNDDHQETIVTAGKNLVATVSQLTIDHSWHFIADIWFEIPDDQVMTGFEIREYNTWFKTLFRLIISPNAP